MLDLSSLPSPLRPRWQPLRLGLVDLFQYDQEEIHFRDGNLLLRGNNGTGKSKVLALSLPFLLDGQLIAARVEPDGDPGKRMEWNLLLGGQYQERLGYVWLEFGRLDEDGEARFLTIGCGMRAVAGRGAPERWFFLTPQRVGDELHLLDANRRALSRDRLLDAVGQRGELHTSAAGYRQAVDQALFGLGQHRYEALINLLIQLRQPQLSKRPDEKALSAALTEALPPLERAVLDDVAEAFRNLEEERKTLDGLSDARRSIGEFLGHYQRYCAVAARRRAQLVRQAQSAWERVGSELRETSEALEKARSDNAYEVNRQGFLTLKIEQAFTQRDTLRASPEMRDAQRLEDARKLAAEHVRSVKALVGQLVRTERDLARQESQAAAARRDCDQGAQRLSRLERSCREQAKVAGLAVAHGRCLQPLALPNGEPRGSTAADPRIRIGAECAAAGVERRANAIEQLSGLIAALTRAERAERQERERHEQALAEAEHLDMQRAEAAERVEQQVHDLVTAVRRALDGNHELKVPDADALLAELQDWCRDLEGADPARAELHGAYVSARDRITHDLAEVRRLSQLAGAERQALDEERIRLEQGETAIPPAPYTRAENVRDARPGAPLWQLIDFSDDLSAAERAAIEAALEASGLLDAWLQPDGAVRDAGTWDLLLTPSEPAAIGMDRVLAACVDQADALAAQVKPETVQAVLAGIGWGEQEHAAWISPGGRWRLGPAFGAWGKPEPAYIGHTAREAARRRRLAEIVEALAAIDARLDELERQVARLDERRALLEREWHALPDDKALRAAHLRHDDLHGRLAEQRRQVAELAEALAARRAEAMACREARDGAALDLDLPPGAAELGVVRQGLTDYERHLAGFWPELRHHFDRQGRLDELTAAVTELGERRAEARDQLDRAKDDKRRAEEVYATLRESVGERVESIERRIREAEESLRDFKDQSKINQRRLIETAADVSKLDERHDQLGRRLQVQDAERHTAVDQLAELCALGLLTIADPSLEVPGRERPWPLDPGLRLARAAERALERIKHDDDAWRRQQQALPERFQPLQQTLSRYGHSASVEQSGELLLVRVLFQSRQCGPDELATSLDSEVAERKALLDAKERELLEEHLMSDTASQLQRLIGDGERMVGGINRELAMRPTSTGMKLKLEWLPLDEDTGEAPTGLAEARTRLLRQTSAAWSEADRGAIGTFLKRRIDEVREGHEGGTLVEHLEQALDYRRWHRFRVLRWQGGKWRAAYGPASGGERALVVTLPLFAAASSHYGSARADAPRLVMLDEAFAGIDDDARAKCLGLMAQFDLDFMLTSEREWGCYAEVPGLSIVQLVRHEGIDAVFLSRWSWDGSQRRMEAAPEIGPAPKASDSDSDASPPADVSDAANAGVAGSAGDDPQQSLF